jgi:hypothetical protein
MIIAPAIQAQAPASPVFIGILSSQGSQYQGTRVAIAQTLYNVASITQLGFTQGITKPFGGFGTAVGEGRLSAYPDIDVARLHRFVVSEDGSIKTGFS